LEPTLLPIHAWRGLAAALISTLLVACGGGGGGGDTPAAANTGTNTTSTNTTSPGGTSSETPAGGSPATAVQAPAQALAVEKPATRAEAARFLTQSTFGPTDADIERVMRIGYAAWIDEQLALPSTSHRAWFETRDQQIKAASPGSSAWHDQVYESFWKQALTGPDQLRQRTAFALSQIFVISMAASDVGDHPRAVAAWMDMLGTEGLGSYRQLLESVSRHPLMGIYLSHMRNQRADTRTGRVPDENYAREVMQLFSIGLVELNEDGSPRTSAGNGAGTPIETYTPADISGLAQVFTGWSWSCPNWPDNSCFFWGSADGSSDTDRSFNSMLGYPQYHSREEKRFLGAVVPAQALPDPQASLKLALDTLAANPNVGPFIGRQLIQRLVTSNPSPTYVRDVARVFANNGAGVRGDMKALVKAVLMHPEARVVSDTSGKLREPILKLSAYLRAFAHSSDSGNYRVGNTDNPGNSLAQTPMRAPSVFNFYRPGYVPPGTASAARKLAVPELQIANETSTAGYVNFMRDSVSNGVGQWNGVVGGVTRNRNDLQPDLSAELALATDPVALTERVVGKLVVGDSAAALKAEIADAVGRITIPALNSSGSNQSQVNSARRTRVNAALLLTLASPEFAVQP
jgi:uncharacterized protein (DUF1800 family)